MTGFKLDWSFEPIEVPEPTDCPDFATMDFLSTSAWTHQKMLNLAADLDWAKPNHANGMRNLLKYSRRK